MNSLRFLKLLIPIGLLVALFPAAEARALSTFQQVKAAHRSSEAVILDRLGEVVHELRIDKKGRRLDLIELPSVSPALVKAVLLSEDRRFYEHCGGDRKAAGAAAIGRIIGSKKRGASTISMQLAFMLKNGPAPKGRKNLHQKWDQMEAAWDLEKNWKKDEILEAYLNLITFRSELQGIAAASRGIFDKETSGLNDRESAVLAAPIRSPNALPSKVGQRAAVLYRELAPQVNDTTIQTFAVQSLSHPYRVRSRIVLAPHVARQLTSGTNLSRTNGTGASASGSTLELRLQRFAQDILRQQLYALRGRNVGDAALLVVDNTTGNILAYVGSATDSQVDGVMAKRQAGSTLKPFLYGLALEKRLLTAASILDDSPLHIPTARGLYVPHDYDRRARGPVSVRTALSSSLNIPAVRTQLLVGTEPFAHRLRQAGFDLAQPAEFYGFSLALGTADVSLRELVNAYRALAQGGMWERAAPYPRPRGQVQASNGRRVRPYRNRYLADRNFTQHRLRLRQSPHHPLLERRQDRDQQRHARQLVHRLFPPLHRRRLGRQLQRRTHAERLRHLRSRPGLAGSHELPPPGQPQQTTGKAQGVVARTAFQTGSETDRNELFLAGTEPVQQAMASRQPQQALMPRVAIPLQEPSLSSIRIFHRRTSWSFLKWKMVTTMNSGGC